MIFTIQIDTEKDDIDQIKKHISVDDYYSALFEIHSYLRNKYKHGDFKTKETCNLVEKIYQEINEIIIDSGIEL